MLDLSGKTALVCGASKGIGKATAELLYSLNANVILLARSEDKLVEIVKEFESIKEAKDIKSHASYIAVDITNKDILKEKVLEKIKEYESIDILINNTGGPKAGLIIDASNDDFISAFNNHVLVNSLLSQLVIPQMKINNFGRIINIISTSVKIPINNLGVSNTIRAAVASWAKTLSNEVAQFGITVNNVLPGYTDTERLSELITNAAQKSGKSFEQTKNDWINLVPSKRFAEPSEIANAVAFLASDKAGYINGINLPVDGGRTGTL